MNEQAYTHFHSCLSLLLVLALCFGMVFSTGCNLAEDPDSSAPNPDDIASNVTGATDNDGTENSTYVDGNGNKTTATTGKGDAGTSTTSGKTNSSNKTTNKTINKITNKTTGKTTQKTTMVGTVAIPADLGSGTIYYVSSSTGSDKNDGKSPAKAFKTTAPVNQLWLEEGDSVLFKRGDTFVDANLSVSGSGKAEKGKWITFDAYGTGAKPLFKWKETSAAAISLSKSTASGGYRIRNIDMDGYLGGILGTKKSKTQTLDGLEVDNCTIKNITRFKKYGQMSYAEGQDAGYGIFFRHVRNATFTNLSIITTDVPIHFEGELTHFKNIYCYENRITGVLLYGTPLADSNYQAVMKAAGQIVFEDARILYTGISGLYLGTTGMMLENLHNAHVENVEIAYSVNGADNVDGNGITLENLNIDTTLKDIYVHDNDGPALVAMEHGDTAGYSQNNKIINWISVNNGKRANFIEGSFLNQYLYNKSTQKLIIENCIDIGSPGSVPYKYYDQLRADFFPNKPVVSNFTSGVIDVYGTFDNSDLSAFSHTSGASVANGHLNLTTGSKLRTQFSSSNYVVSSWLRGEAGLVFMGEGTTNGYLWEYRNDKILAKKMTNSGTSKIKEISVPGLKVTDWFETRIEAIDGIIKTYVDGALVSTIKDKTFTSGKAGINAGDTAQVDQFFVYRYANAARTVCKAPSTGVWALGGALTATSMSGNYHEVEVNWKPSSGIGDHIYRRLNMAHSDVAHSDVVGKNAYLERSHMNVNVDGGYNKVYVSLVNATTSDKLYIDFSTDNGNTWHTKEIRIAATSTDNCYPFKTLWPGLKSYVVDMSGVSEWKGKINGLRVRTGGTSGFISLEYVKIAK